ncbi:MAG: N-acetylmuramidase [Clostridia bacterium]|nr:N-acetylmuramidase [Clostridia bacterium]
MNDYFEEAFKRTLGYEGGLSNDKYDAGGLTKYGISQRSYPNLDIKNLTLDQAKAIYKKNYWDACHCGEINDKKVAMQVFDIAINSGCGGAGKLVQKTLNAMAPHSVVEDGSIGPKTIEAINKVNSKQYNNNLVAARIQFYNAICQRNPTQNKFLKGWTNRAMGFVLK